MDGIRNFLINIIYRFVKIRILVANAEWKAFYIFLLAKVKLEI